MSARATLACLLVLLLGGCANPYLTRRHTFSSWEQARTPRINVSAFVLDPPGGTAQATLLSLSPRGQAELIRALSEKAKTNDELLQALATQIKKKSTPGVVRDLTRVKRRVVLSVERWGERRWNPEDRIQNLRCTLSGIKGGRFVSWDRFETQYETIEFGKLTMKQSQSGELSLSAGPGAGAAAPVSGGAKTSFSRDLTEEVSLRQRFVVLTGMLTPTEAALNQEGVVGIDLSGNTTADITIALAAGDPSSVVKLKGLKKSSGEWQDQADVEARQSFVRPPAGKSDVTATLTCAYVIRSVRWQGWTIIEGDDSVDMVEGAVQLANPVTLAPATRLKKRVWLVGRNDGSAVEYDSPAGMDAMKFESYEEAMEFLEWLRAKGRTQGTPVTVDDRRLEISGSALAPVMIPNLMVITEEL